MGKGSMTKGEKKARKWTLDAIEKKWEISLQESFTEGNVHKFNFLGKQDIEKKEI